MNDPYKVILSIWELYKLSILNCKFSQVHFVIKDLSFKGEGKLSLLMHIVIVWGCTLLSFFKSMDSAFVDKCESSVRDGHLEFYSLVQLIVQSSISAKPGLTFKKANTINPVLALIQLWTTLFLSVQYSL